MSHRLRAVRRSRRRRTRSEDDAAGPMEPPSLFAKPSMTGKTGSNWLHSQKLTAYWTGHFDRKQSAVSPWQCRLKFQDTDVSVTLAARPEEPHLHTYIHRPKICAVHQMRSIVTGYYISQTDEDIVEEMTDTRRSFEWTVRERLFSGAIRFPLRSQDSLITRLEEFG